MENIDFDKNFRFSLYQEDVLLYERTFDANMISPFTRNSIDIRSDVFDIIKKLQNLLSRKKYSFKYETKKSGVLYNFYECNNNYIASFPKDIGRELVYKPRIHKKVLEDKELTGVSCKFMMQINDNLIIERLFYVENFNPLSRYSLELVKELDDIVFNLQKKIIKTDVVNIWDDYDIINRTGMTISQVREMDMKERKRWIYKISR